MSSFAPLRLLTLFVVAVVSVGAAAGYQSADHAALLRQQLEDADFAVRAQGLEGLVRYPQLVLEMSAKVLALSKDPHALVRERAMAALHQLAADKNHAGAALTVLLERFGDADARVRLAAVRAVLNLNGARHRKEGTAVLLDLLRRKSDLRAEAIYLLALTGEHGKKALPDLVNICKTGSGSEVENCVIVLIGFKHDLAPMLPDLVKQVGTWKSTFALDLLANECVQRDMDITPILRRLLVLPGEGEGMHLLRQSFNRDGPARTMKLLIPLLRDPDPIVRLAAASVMGHTIPETHDLFPLQVGNALAQLARTDKALVDNLLANIKEKHPAVRWHSATTLVMTRSPRAKEVVPLMIQWLETEDPDSMGIHLRPSGLLLLPDPDKAAALAFAAVAKANEAYRHRLAIAVIALPHAILKPYILRALESDQLVYHHFAITALNHLPYSFTSAKFFPALMPAAAKLLGEDTPLDLRLQTAWFMIRSGDPKTRYDEPALKVLEVCLVGEDPAMRQRSLELLQAMRDRAAPAAPALLKSLKDSREAFRFQAAQLLFKLDPRQVGPVVAVIKEILESPKGSVDTDSVLWFTASLGPRAEPLAPSLLALVGDAKSSHRIRAGIALLRVGGEPKRSELVLQAVQQAMAGDPKWTSRRDLIEAIRALGPAARPILPDIEKLFAAANKPIGPSGRDRRRTWAVTAAAIDPAADSVGTRFVRGVLQDEKDLDRLCDALEELEGNGRHAKVFVPELKSLLGSKESEVVECTIRVLAAIGPEAKEAVPELRKIAADAKDLRLRRIADRAIAQIAGK